MKRSILIADADAYLAGIYARKFEEGGWDVRVAESRADAEKRLAKRIPDALILDIQTIDGAMGLLRDMREDDRLRPMVRVALTKLGDRGAVQEAHDAGADGYLLKGHFVPLEVRGKLEALVDARAS